MRRARCAQRAASHQNLDDKLTELSEQKQFGDSIYFQFLENSIDTLKTVQSVVN